MQNSDPIILLTRPKDQAMRFADMCRAALENPKIIIAPVLQIELLAITRSLAPYTGLIFTSENGVKAYISSFEQRDLPAYCVGDRTTKAARQAGMTAYSAKGSADDLVALVLGAPTGRYLHIRGEHSRGGIATRLGQDEVIAYRQAPVPLTDEARAALMGVREIILPLFSPRTARLFFEDTGEIKAPMCAIAISRSVAGEIPGQPSKIAAAPDAASVLQEIIRHLST